jgi:hypothetical protein
MNVQQDNQSRTSATLPLILRSFARWFLSQTTFPSLRNDARVAGDSASIDSIEIAAHLPTPLESASR